MKKVIAITGIGGIGIACARRIGANYKLVLGDYNQEQLDQMAEQLQDAGYDVATEVIDVSDNETTERFAQKAAELGEIAAIIHTAGVSPNMVDPNKILEINLVGTARIIESFEPFLKTDTVGVFVSSNSGYLSRPLSDGQRANIRKSKADELAQQIREWGITDPAEAYVLSKRANHLQVTSSASRWGKSGARIVSVSPGIISTPMSKKERKTSQQMEYMLQNSPVNRIGNPEDIAALVAFLISSEASFITGTDILVDGGVNAFISNRD